MLFNRPILSMWRRWMVSRISSCGTYLDFNEQKDQCSGYFLISRRITLVNEIFTLPEKRSHSQFTCYVVLLFFVFFALYCIQNTFSLKIIHLKYGLCYFCHEIYYKASSTTPLFIEVPVPSQESERSCICMLRVSIWPLSTIVPFDVWILNYSGSVVFFVFHCIIIFF